MCSRFIIEKRSLRHCCVEGLSKMCGGLGIGERKGGGRGDLPESDARRISVILIIFGLFLLNSIVNGILTEWLNV